MVVYKEMMHWIFIGLFVIAFKYILNLQNQIDELSEQVDYLEDVVKYKK